MGYSLHWSVHIPAARINSTPIHTKDNCLHKVKHIITADTGSAVLSPSFAA
jgi:hypothetical protein